jgi:hypothetical protein
MLTFRCQNNETHAAKTLHIFLACPERETHKKNEDLEIGNLKEQLCFGGEIQIK